LAAGRGFGAPRPAGNVAVLLGSVVFPVPLLVEMGSPLAPALALMLAGALVLCGFWAWQARKHDRRAYAQRDHGQRGRADLEARAAAIRFSLSFLRAHGRWLPVCARCELYEHLLGAWEAVEHSDHAALEHHLSAAEACLEAHLPEP
jgi:hypothetical protein